MELYFKVVTVITLFLVGTVLGSFLNVVAYRSLNNKDWIKGNSECDSCGNILKWYDLIPILSYLFLNGKCRYCNKKIDSVHFKNECLFGFSYLFLSIIINNILLLIIILLLITIIEFYFIKFIARKRL